MPLLLQHDFNLYVAVKDKIIAYSSVDGVSKLRNLPEVIVPPNLSKGQEDVLRKGRRDIACMCTSRDGKYLALTTHNKQLVVLATNSFDLVRNSSLSRVASKLVFTPSDDILIADKTGDAYLYKLTSENEPVLFLGHLSMLLDVSISICGKYVATSDRDEKIRVSHYPNAYNVLSYCLGHREFVTNIEFCGDRLVSASGDGTVRFWDYKNGKEVGLIDTNKEIRDDTIKKFCDKMDEDSVEVKALPITDMQVYSNSEKTHIVVSLLNVNQLLIYECNFTDSLAFSLLQKLVLSEKPLCFSLSRSLYVLTRSEISVHSFNGTEYVQSQDDALSKLWDEYVSVFENCGADEDVSVLYKRKFDNVQEYLERKKLRLENK